MTDLTDNRFTTTFAHLRAEGRRALLPFITAGYPDLQTTLALLRDFEARGVRFCELGVPFSDPIADGPTIQASYSRALADGVTSAAIFDMVRRYRADGGQMALAAMVSYSIVYRHGVEPYLAAAAEAGFDGTIVPDLPVDEAGSIEPIASRLGLANILLVAPTTAPQRRREIARHSRGFLYYISVAGITGQREALPEATIDAVTDLRGHASVPICVGFGISRPEMVAAVCRAADGAIVGSAIVRRITDCLDLPTDQLTASVGEFVGELLAPLA